MESVPGALCSLLLILNPAGVESPQPVRLASCPALHTRTASGLGPSVTLQPAAWENFPTVSLPVYHPLWLLPST